MQLQVLFAVRLLERRDAATLKILVCGEGFENFGLAQRQVDLFIVFGIADNQVLNLRECQSAVQ